MSYHIEPNNKFFHAARGIVENETHPASTVRFSSLIDLTEVEEVRAEAARAGKEKPSYTAFVAKAMGLALREFPYANRRVVRRPWLFFLGPRLQKFHNCDVAVAVERDIPGMDFITFIDIIRSADQKSLEEIADWLRKLAKADTTNNTQWRQFKTLIERLPTWLSNFIIRLPVYIPSMWVKYRGGAVLLSSPAKYGVDMLTANWSSPMGASFGLVKKRPIVDEETGELVVRPTVHLFLNFDRRVMAGAQGARFFKRFVDLMEHAKTELATPAPATAPAAAIAPASPAASRIEPPRSAVA